MTIYFTSDQHFAHQSILQHCYRPFSSIQEQDETLIENHNKVVQPTDTIYMLGDVAWKLNIDQLKILFKKLNGIKRVILGNHDNVSYLRNLANQRVIESLHDTCGVTINGQYIWLSHYPHRAWDRSFHGSWQLAGHTHGNCEPYGKSCDVGIDCWNYTPVSFEELKSLMDKLHQVNAEDRVNTRWFGKKCTIIKSV